MSYASYKILNKSNLPISSVTCKELDDVEAEVEKTLKRPGRYEVYEAWVAAGKRIRMEGDEQVFSLAERQIILDAMELRRLEGQLQDVVSKSKKILDKYPDTCRAFVAAQIFHQIFGASKDFDSVISDLEMAGAELGIEVLG